MKNNRFISLFVVVAILAFLYNIFFAYDQLRRIHHLQLFIAKNQAENLNAFLKAFRESYQDTFIHKHIPFNEETINLLPVVTIPDISRRFENYLSSKASIKTVSDNPRDPKNMANELEKRTIAYFRSHSGIENYYTLVDHENDKTFFFAAPLYIKKSCLRCHGKREDAPAYIRENYDKAYDYEIGDLRGITAIYFSQKQLNASLSAIVYQNIVVMLAISLVFLFIFYILTKKIYKNAAEYTQNLEREVENKTKALQTKSMELEHRLYHDPLTRLRNRNALIQDLHSSVPKALILINIDDFKQINDFYGHSAGDKLIQGLAKLLKAECRIDTCDLYRMPADEFAILIYDDLSQERLETFITHLVKTINNHDFDIDENVVHLRIAIGASNDGADLLITADMAMKKAKADRADYVIYDPSMDLSEKYAENLEWAEKIKQALEEDRIVPYFQPIVSTGDNRVKSYEALVRLIDENGTVHSPFYFLDVAKQTKFYPDLTKRVIDKTFTYFKDKPYDFSINISYLDIMNKETMTYIIDRIESFSDAGRIHFEILESEGIERYEEVSECLKKLRRLGCHISLDDFGSGYSSFEHILKLEVDMLKIDGALIKNIDTDISSQIVVETIIDFANKLQIDTCAEFVSSKAIYDTVKDLGVTYVQGYYISEPKPNLV
ncbi:hypothetical protein HCR_22530 [Hydrogenimonas cancrithermarum]|uniref:Diguanylate cyclase/phosphodiesterase n=2 Tax=Hydrogenimonas cancrithermarum TaxID=2993563 RepID=A0ABM8FNL1_9BACT|nr:hypothetical protein HCR_22530 [Hydrogenimonas cancrithermarum]